MCPVLIFPCAQSLSNPTEYEAPSRSLLLPALGQTPILTQRPLPFCGLKMGSVLEPNLTLTRLPRPGCRLTLRLWTRRLRWWHPETVDLETAMWSPPPTRELLHCDAAPPWYPIPPSASSLRPPVRGSFQGRLTHHFN